MNEALKVRRQLDEMLDEVAAEAGTAPQALLRAVGDFERIDKASALRKALAFGLAPNVAIKDDAGEIGEYKTAVGDKVS